MVFSGKASIFAQNSLSHLSGSPLTGCPTLFFMDEEIHTFSVLSTVEHAGEFHLLRVNADADFFLCFAGTGHTDCFLPIEMPGGNTVKSIRIPV